MKLRLKRDVSVDVQRRGDEEVWYKSFRKWDEIRAESLNYLPDGKTANVITYDGDVILFLPKDAFEVLK